MTNTAMEKTTVLADIPLGDRSALPVAIISIISAFERREVLLENKIPADWVKKFFPAIDFRGMELDDVHAQTDKDYFFRRYGGLLSPAQVGCARSHYEVARWLEESRHDMILVLEDDVIPLGGDFLNRVWEVADQFRPKAKEGVNFIVHLGVSDRWHQKVTHRKLVLPKHLQSRYFLYTDISAGLWYAHAYILSRAAAESILCKERKLKSNVDDWLFRRQLGIIDYIFYCQPCIFGQNQSLASTLELGRHRDIKAEQSSFFLSRLIGAALFRTRVFGSKLMSKFALKFF